MFKKGSFLQEELGDVTPSSGAPAAIVESATPAPVTVETSSAEASSPGSDADWVELSSPDEDNTTPTGRGTPVVPKVVTPEVVPAPTTPVAAAAAIPVVTPLATPTPIQPITPPTQESAPVEPTTHAQLREQEMTRLQGYYALSDEDARLAVVQPEAVLPKLAASLHLNIVDSVVQAVLSRVPEIARASQERERAVAGNETKFYNAWPGLNKPEYKDTVFRAVAAYRQLNPQATMEEVIRAAGLQATIHLRLALPRELLEQNVPAPVATTHTPAIGVSHTQPVRPNAVNNPFEVLSQEFVDFDRN